MVWNKYISTLNTILQNFVITNKRGNQISHSNGFSHLMDVTLQNIDRNNKVFLIGNGASATMASHVAADLHKAASVNTEIFTDLAMITALANDFSYDQVFSEPIRKRIKKDDILVAISSSGMSANILNAADSARQHDGFIVTFSAMQQDNRLRSKGDLNFYVKADTYGMAEICHTAMLHFWIDSMADRTKGSVNEL